MKTLTAKRSLTLSSERCNPSFGRKYDVSRTQVAPKRDSPEEVRRTVSWICQHVKRSREWFRNGGTAIWKRGRRVCAIVRMRRKAIHACLVAGDVPSHPSNSRPIDATTGTAATLSFGRCSDDPSRVGLSGYHPLPSLRTIERILQRGERTSPAFRVQPCASSRLIRSHGTRHSNQRHQLDLIGPLT